MSILKDTPEFGFYTLAPNAGSDIIKEKSDQSAAGNAAENAGGKDEAAGKGSNPYSQLGIEDADYQAFREGKLAEDNLLGIANAASYYKAASGSGAGTFLYQNEAHEQAANIRAKYDPNYLKNDTYDYTHGGLYDKSRVEPMPGPPKYEVLTSLPKVGNEDEQASGENDQEEEQSATPGEMLASVLTQEQKRRVDDGENLFTIIEELDSGKRRQIDEMAQGIYDSLSDPQKKDLIFIVSSYAFGGESLDTRQAILGWLKDNQREITYEDLVKLDFYAPGEMEGAGRDWASTINLEYDLVYHKGASIAMFDREQRLQQGMEMSMLYAMALAPLVNTAVYGRTLAPQDKFNANSHLDSIERDGWSFKGPQSFIPAPEVAGNPGGQAGGTTGLPKTTKESVDTKLSTYLLDPNHPSGGSKAKWFKEALGFTNENAGDLEQQIVFDPSKAMTTLTNEYGTKYSQIISVRGVNGRIIDVEFIWIKNNDGVIRLVTSIPTKK